MLTITQVLINILRQERQLYPVSVVSQPVWTWWWWLPKPLQWRGSLNKTQFAPVFWRQCALTIAILACIGTEQRDLISGPSSERLLRQLLFKPYIPEACPCHTAVVSWLFNGYPGDINGAHNRREAAVWTYPVLIRQKSRAVVPLSRSQALRQWHVWCVHHVVETVPGRLPNLKKAKDHVKRMIWQILIASVPPSDGNELYRAARESGVEFKQLD